MHYVDSVILDLTERACHRIQRLTGATNVWLAVQLTNVSVIGYFAWAAAVVWSSRGLTRVLIVAFCAALAYALGQTVFKVPIEMSEASAYQRVARGLRNPRRIRDALLRVSFLTVTGLLIYPVVFVYLTLQLRIFLLAYFLLALTTVVLYLMACDPLPPCRGTVREWFQNLVGAKDVEGDLQVGP